MSFQLSQDQIDAMQGICTTLLDADPDKSSIAVLTGSAGTGKTTVVHELIQQVLIRPEGLHVELCATTHRAAGVLQDITVFPVRTVHAAFKLRPTVTKYGKETLVAAGVCDIPEGSVVVVDEASMMGNQFLKAVVETIKKKSLKILFVGDPFQLPPPVDICSIFDGSLPTFTLTKVHRQNMGNPILDKAIEYRDFIAGNTSREPIFETCLNADGEGIHMLPHADFVSQFVARYMKYETGAVVDVPLCTYTNESAVNYNNMVRKAAYFLEGMIAPYYAGERLVANSIVKNANQTLLTNNESVIVVTFRESTLQGIPGYLVTLEGDYSKYTKTRIKTVFCPQSRGAADRVLNVLKKEAIQNRDKQSWIDFYALKNRIADLRPPFAGTTHKIQGGTFPAVFIDRTNILKCRDAATRARLMYVALTRASGNAYINGA